MVCFTAHLRLGWITHSQKLGNDILGTFQVDLFSKRPFLLMIPMSRDQIISVTHSKSLQSLLFSVKSLRKSLWQYFASTVHISSKFQDFYVKGAFLLRIYSVLTKIQHNGHTRHCDKFGINSCSIVLFYQKKKIIDIIGKSKGGSVLKSQFIVMLWRCCISDFW